MFISKLHFKIVAEHKTDHGFFPSEHLLFFLKGGKGSLRSVWYALDKNDPPYEDCYGALSLNGLPLYHVQSSGCPTCESLLAAGYGISEECTEIRDMAEGLLKPYTGLGAALDRLSPFLGLLRDGGYMLSASGYFPTNGEGKFFWDVPNDFTTSSATADLYDQENYRYLACAPCYLYPSQPTQKFDESRVEYYRAKLQAGEVLPYALAYSGSGTISVLLDGHHRACACALEGVQLPCLTISSPLLSWRDGEVDRLYWPSGESTEIGALTEKQKQILLSSRAGDRIKKNGVPKSGQIFQKDWPVSYGEAAQSFPTYREAVSLALYREAQLTAQGIVRLAESTENDETETAVQIIHYLSRQKNVDSKALAMAFVREDVPQALRLAAFKELNRCKNDPEIEDLFVDFLVNCDDPHNALWIVANGYWEK